VVEDKAPTAVLLRRRSRKINLLFSPDREFLSFVNLAPWKYRNILSTDGGPVGTLEIFLHQSSLLHSVYEAFAILDPKVAQAPPVGKTYVYDFSSDGCGTSIYPSQARYKSISEALERWAFYALVYDEADKYGFDIDRSTTGMASYPGITARSARENAFDEALERWALCAWWEGLLPTRIIPPSPEKKGWRGAEILTPFQNKSVVLLWSNVGTTDQTSYSFACGNKPERAIGRALVELDRNQRAISGFFKTQGPSVSISFLEDPIERRLMHFASPSGFQAFQERMESSSHMTKMTDRPPLVVDQAIPGPWNRYTQVWRCLFQPISDDFQSDRLDYFLF
jgi:hypothetical protein